MGGLQFEANLGKKVSETLFKKKVKHSSICL
jgi:hypothetical protein